MFRKLLLTTSAAVLMLALHSAAQAAPVVVTSQFGVTATITGVSLTGSGTNQTFKFTINNTSSTGSITAIGFDLDGNFGAFSLTSRTNTNFTLVSDLEPKAGAQNFSSNFDFGLVTGNGFNGGTVAEGIGPGQSATFEVTGNFGNLSANEIAALVFARFQGIGPRDESDVITVTPPPQAVPEPATMILLGTGLAGVAANARRRRKAAKN